MELTATIRLHPYEDGSGFQHEVTSYPMVDGPGIRVSYLNSSVEFTEKQWREIRDAVEKVIRFRTMSADY